MMEGGNFTRGHNMIRKAGLKICRGKYLNIQQNKKTLNKSKQIYLPVVCKT